MSNRKKHLDERQLGLFAIHLQPEAPPAAGSMNISMRLRQAVSEAIRKSGKRIEHLCAEIYGLTGEEVAVSSLRKWSAPSSDFTNCCEDTNGNKRWGIPAEIVPAFCQVCGDWEVLFIQAEAGHFKALKGKEVVHARMGQLKERMSKDAQEMKELERRLMEAHDGR